MKDLHEADFVVEAVVESLEIKKAIFRELEGIVAPEAILATNTSSLSVTEISTANAHPGRVIGVHFFNPAPVQNLVEIVRTVVTEPTRSSRTSRRWSSSSARTPSSAATRPGFIANTLLFGYLNHAVAMFEGKFASREDIDAAMRFGCGYPMGPLQLLDLIGLDTAYEILETMYRQGRDRLHAPGADPQADGHRRHARPQDRPRLLHLRRPGQPAHRGRRPDAVRRRPAAAPAPASRRVGVVGTGTMASGIVEVFAKAGYDVLFVGRSQDKVDGVVAAITKNFDKQIQRGRATEDDKAAVLARVTGSTSLDDLQGRRHRGRGDRRGPGDQEDAVREPRRDLQARRDPGDHDLVAAGHRAGPGHRPARRTSSACTSSTPRR